MSLFIVNINIIFNYLLNQPHLMSNTFTKRWAAQDVLRKITGKVFHIYYIYWLLHHNQFTDQGRSMKAQTLHLQSDLDIKQCDWQN